MKKVNKHFVSDIDQKLAEFDRTHKPSASQVAEKKKYQKIFEMRDSANVSHEDLGDIWQ